MPHSFLRSVPSGGYRQKAFTSMRTSGQHEAGHGIVSKTKCYMSSMTFRGIAGYRADGVEIQCFLGKPAPEMLSALNTTYCPRCTNVRSAERNESVLWELPNGRGVRFVKA